MIWKMRVLVGLFYGLLVIFPISVAADCFCLEGNRSQQIVHWGCVSTKIKNSLNVVVTCQAPDFVGSVILIDHKDYTKLDEGTGFCLPCHRSAEEDFGDILRELYGLESHGEIEANE